MSLEPFALTFALLVFWTGLGWSLIAMAEPNMQPLRALFLAPVAGVALTLLPVFWLSLIGLPVASFARPLFAVLCCVTVVAWIWRQPAWTLRELIFLIPVIAALLLIGFPMLRFGFDWVGNANDDWANYNLSAIRYLTDGYYQQPSVDAMASGRDYPGYLWFLVVASDGRSGSDLLLALTSAVVGRNPFFVFMPLILALHGILCMAAAAIAMASFRRRDTLFAAVLLTSLAPLSLYAVHQQLIAQVIGLAFMCGTACLIFAPLSELWSRGRIIIAAIFVAAYWLAYPETVPFFGVALIIFHLLRLRDPNWGWRYAGKILAIPAIAGILLGPYAISFFFYLFSQIGGSVTQGVHDGVSIFPYFSVPNGLAVLFGFSRLGEFFREPMLSISIAAAFLMVAATLVGLSFDFTRKRAVGAYLIAIVLAAVFLVKQHNDFGLFKLAMFAQTFIWFAILLALAKLGRRKAIAVYAVILVAIVSSDVRAIVSAQSDVVGSASALYGASKDRLLSKVLDERPADSCNADFVTPNPPLAKIFAASRGCASSFLARPYLLSQFLARSVETVTSNPVHNLSGISQYTETAVARLGTKFTTLKFPSVPDPLLTFQPPVEFSKISDPWSLPSIYRDPNEPPSGELIYLSSSLGSYFYLPEFPKISLFETEGDPFFASGHLAAAGRYLLFRINSPATAYRLVLDLTTTILADGKAQLPAARVLGEGTASIGLVGHGAARVLSPTFKPLVFDGVSYVLLDLGAEAKNIRSPRTGLMALYGNDVDIDYRRVVAFLRTIRLNSEDASFAGSPSKVERFPADLANENLEFSGIYEDGWVGDEGFVVLSSDKPGKVVFRGVFPLGLGLDSVDLALTIEGGAPIRKRLEPGPFELELPVGSGRSRIGFQFSAVGRLPAGDNRPAVALLSSVSIEPGDAKSQEQPKSVNLPKVIAGVGVDADGIFLDGWLSQKSFVIVNPAQAGKAVLRGMVPGSIGLDDQEIQIANEVGDTVRKKLETGPFEIEVPVKAGRSKISIDFSQAANLPKGDGRNVAALLLSMALTPTSD